MNVNLLGFIGAKDFNKWKYFACRQHVTNIDLNEYSSAIESITINCMLESFMWLKNLLK